MKSGTKKPANRYAAKPFSWLGPLQIINPAKVLLVEDDADIQQLLRFFIESAGANIDVVGSSEQAIEYLQNEPRLTCFCWTECCQAVVVKH